MDLDQPNEPLAVLPCSVEGRLHFSWGLGNELYVCKVQNPNEEPSDEGDVPTAHCLRWGCPTPARRQVAYEAANLYEQLKVEQAGKDGADRYEDRSQSTAVLSYSRKISKVLDRPVVGGDDIANSELTLAQELTIWQLLETLFVDTGRVEGIITEDLVRWLAANHHVLVQPSDSVEALLDGLHTVAAAESHPGYFRALQRLTALGRLDEASELLGLHSAWQRRFQGDANPATQAVIDVMEPIPMLMRRMPHFRRPGAGAEASGMPYDSLPSFLAYRQLWQEQCHVHLRDDALWQAASEADGASVQGLRAVVAILAGTEDVLVSACSNWLELLVGSLLHLYPQLRPAAELDALKRRCQAMLRPDRGPGPPLLNFLDQLLPAAADGEAQAVMREVSGVGSAWLMAHLPDLLTASPPARSLLARPQPHLGGDQMEFYRLEWAMALMPYATTWQTAIAYLAWCPVHGMPAAQALLSRLPVAQPDDRVALKALRIAARHSLPAVRSAICRAMGAARWWEGRSAAAVEWLLRGGDTLRAGLVAGSLIEQLESELHQPGSFDPAGATGQQLGALQALLDMAAGCWSEAPDGPASPALEPQTGCSRIGGSGGLAFLQGCMRLQDALQQFAGLQDLETKHAQGVRQAARAAVIDLLVGGAAPKPMWLLLLFRSIPLLTTSPPAFSQQDAHLLMQRLEAVASASGLPPVHIGTPDAQTQMQAVRLALAQGLMQAHIAGS